MILLSHHRSPLSNLSSLTILSCGSQYFIVSQSLLSYLSNPSILVNLPCSLQSLVSHSLLSSLSCQFTTHFLVLNRLPVSLSVSYILFFLSRQSATESLVSHHHLPLSYFSYFCHRWSNNLSNFPPHIVFKNFLLGGAVEDSWRAPLRQQAGECRSPRQRRSGSSCK